jgi:serine/threonine protein kinase
VKELWGDYDTYQTGPGPLEKITSKADVFGVGQVMYNLVMNLPGRNGKDQEPFYDNEGTRGKLLVNGERYNSDSLSAEQGRFMSGQTPYEASSMYSKELKDTIRMCLRYDQKDRPTVEKLRTLVQKYAGEELQTKADGVVTLDISRKIQDLRVGKAYESLVKRREGE